MFKKLKVMLLAASLVLPSAVYASALTTEKPILISAPVTAVPISAEVGTESDDALLADAIIKAKEYLGDTDRFASMSHSISDYYGIKLFYLYWYDSENEGETLSAAIGSDGVLYRFSVSNYDGEAKLPVITKNDALEIAYTYAVKVDPSSAFISKDFATVSYMRWSGYEVTFQSTYNGYAIKGNDITVTVSPDGKVTGFDAFDMARGVVTPENPETLISETAAKAALKTSLPLELIYKSFYSYDEESDKYTAKIKLVYKLADDYASKAVDAVTGETIEYETKSYEGAYDGAESPVAGEANSSAGQGSKLTEAELKSIELQAGLLTADAITAKLRAVAEFGMTDGYTLYASNLYSSESPYDGTLTYYWQLSYRTGEGDDKENSNYAYAMANAKTGEITSYSNYTGTDNKPVTEFKYTEEQCKSAAEKLLAALYGNKFTAYVYTDNAPIVYPLDAEEESISSYTFSYVRTVSGVKFPTDMITVTVNPDTLGAISLDFGYTDVGFPSAEGAISAGAAADKYFAIVALKPYFIAGLGISDGKLLTPDIAYSPDEKQLTPVYAYTYFCYVDAMDGGLLGYDGKAAEYTPVEYFERNVTFVDLASSAYAEAIFKLYNMDIIGMDDTRFEPDRAITVGELSEMLQNAGYWYQLDGDKDSDQTASVTVEDALYRVVCALGYADIATIDGIFKYPYENADEVSVNRVGAVAITYALGLLQVIVSDGGTLNPTADLTRGQAAQLVYNLLVHQIAKG